MKKALDMQPHSSSSVLKGVRESVCIVQVVGRNYQAVATFRRQQSCHVLVQL
jgi:hypothetical protein